LKAKRSLRRTAFGDDGVSGFPGCLREGGFNEEAYKDTKKCIQALVKKARNGEKVSNSDIWALCNIIDEQHRFDDDDDSYNALTEIMGLIEKLFDKPIKSFRGKNGFLSNFYECDVLYDGINYKSSEAAFQAQKCVDFEERKIFADLTAAEAKKLGRKVKLRKDWAHIKYSIKEGVVKAKFQQNPDLAKMLIDTGDAPLVEGNNWGETIWGVDSKTGIGSNYLGIILMDIRDELRQLD